MTTTAPTIIRTSYIGPRGFRGSVVIARGPNPTTGRPSRRSIPYDHAAGPGGSHVAAAVAFARNVSGMADPVAVEIAAESFPTRRAFTVTDGGTR